MTLYKEQLPPLPQDWEWAYFEPYDGDPTRPPSVTRERDGWILEIGLASDSHYTPTFRLVTEQGDGAESNFPSWYVFDDIPLAVFTQLDHAARLFFGIP